MAKKKLKTDSAPKDKPFRAAHFAMLKGVVLPQDIPAPSLPATVKSIPESAEDEAALFQQAMVGIRPLVAGAASTVPIVEAGHKLQRKGSVVGFSGELDASPDFINEIKRLKLEVTFSDEQPGEDELKPLSGNRLRQLKRGIVSVGAQLDLHGLTRDEALSELPRFLHSAQVRRESAVLVITGKGNNSPAEPVLQQAVAAWLRDSGRSLAAEFAPAPREMGGNGAFVVFLKKNKP